jgi:hypothetical protein
MTAINIHHNPHLGKSTTQCSGHHLTSHIPHPILHYFPSQVSKTTKGYFRLTINPIIISQPTTHNLFPLPQITYPLPLPQITYPPTNNRTKQPKTEPNLPPPPPQQSNNFPMHDTIQAITEGSNTDFENKRK